MAEAGVSRDDLRAAVASGILDEAQATRLIALADQRQGYRANMIGDDEPFELFKGFAEIFVTVGLVLLISGLLGLSAIFGDGASIPFVAAALSVAFAFYFTRKRRMSLPSIALCISFALSGGFVITALTIWDKPEPLPRDLLILGVVGMAMMLGYFRLFRPPFTMVPLGIFGLIAIFGVIGMIDPALLQTIDDPTSFFDLRGAPHVAVGTLVFGVIAFIAAISFDIKDPHRVSRYASTAFWLHLLAAPALVNTLVMSNYQVGGLVGTTLAIVALIVFTLLAIIIDRRSFLTAGLIYMGLLIAGAIADTGTDWAPVLTLLVLGAFVTGLGAFWTQMRALVMGALPDFPGKDRLPPYADGLAVPK